MTLQLLWAMSKLILKSHL